MSKKATEIYMDQVTIGGVAYPPKAKAAVTINIGKMKTIAIPLGQAEGWVNELVVKQVPQASGGGTSIGFDVELLDSKGPYYAAGDSTNREQAYNATPSLTIDFFRVLDGKKTATAGNAVSVQKTDYGYPFINRDGPTHTSPDKFLYLTIIPNNALDATKWEISITYSREID